MLIFWIMELRKGSFLIEWNNKKLRIMLKYLLKNKFYFCYRMFVIFFL